MTTGELIKLSRPVDVTEIPSGMKGLLPEGTSVRVVQSLGGSYTIMSDYGYMYRVDAKDAEALGISSTAQPEAAQQHGTFDEKLMWDQLKTVYDPEIPVNIVDLGLIYESNVSELEQGGKRIDVKMSMTAPGCGMGNVLKADVQSKLSSLPEVKEVQVEVVFNPPWTPARMSEAARLQLGLDLDYPSSSPAYR